MDQEVLENNSRPKLEQVILEPPNLLTLLLKLWIILMEVLTIWIRWLHPSNIINPVQRKTSQLTSSLPSRSKTQRTTISIINSLRPRLPSPKETARRSCRHWDSNHCSNSAVLIPEKHQLDSKVPAGLLTTVSLRAENQVGYFLRKSLLRELF